jgi:diguanylate cyclase (GGDEF)-like protein
VLLNATAVYDEQGQYVMSRSTLFDITVRKHYEAQIHKLAYHDALTGLPNRQLLWDRMNQGIAKTERSQSELAVLFLDLDKFKNVNDQLGHDIGDELLKQVAVRVSASVRESDTVARTGGDEFIIVLPEINQPQDAELVAQKILKALSSLTYVQGYELDVSASIGIAFYPLDGKNILDLMKKADMAMYTAKERGRNCYQVYSEN